MVLPTTLLEGRKEGRKEGTERDLNRNLGAGYKKCGGFAVMVNGQGALYGHKKKTTGDSCASSLCFGAYT